MTEEQLGKVKAIRVKLMKDVQSAINALEDLDEEAGKAGDLELQKYIDHFLRAINGSMEDMSEEGV